MTRFTDSPYESMMTRRPEGREGSFPSSLFISRPPLLWLRNLPPRPALRGLLPQRADCVAARKEEAK